MPFISRFNTYFLLLGVCVSMGCSTTGKDEDDRPASTLMVHLETQEAEDFRSDEVEVFRATGVKIRVDKTAFINTGNVTRAAVVDDFGGFHMRIELDRRGALELETMTAKHVGKRMAVFAHWTETRWLAAIMIRNRIADGVIEFVPDATREEAERIVLGLNNVAEKLRKKERPLLKNAWDEEK